MIIDIDHIDELIANVLSGNANEHERTTLKEWIAADENNRRHFEKMSNTWFASGISKNMNEFDSRVGFKKFSEMVQSSRKSVIHRPQQKRTIRLRVPHIAAMLAVVFVLGAISYRYFESKQTSAVSYFETIVPLGAVSQTVLTDGTKVWLNAGSRLRYATTFAVSERIVQLEGEGYFEVAQNKTLPFEVRTSKLNVKATGTIFNVKAYPNDSIVETILVEGKVEVTRIDDHIANEIPIVLAPEQRLTLVKHSGEMLFETKPKIKNDEQAVAMPIAEEINPVSHESKIRKIPAINDYMVTTSWKDKRWRIDGEELRSLAAKLERRYNVRISFTDSDLQYYRFNGTLEDEPIEAVLKVISQTAPVKFETNGAEVILMRNDKFREQYKDLYNKKPGRALNPSIN